MSEASGEITPVRLRRSRSPRCAKNWPIIPNRLMRPKYLERLIKIFPAAHPRNPAKPQNPPHQQNRRIAGSLPAAAQACCVFLYHGAVRRRHCSLSTLNHQLSWSLGSWFESLHVASHPLQPDYFFRGRAAASREGCFALARRSCFFRRLARFLALSLPLLCPISPTFARFSSESKAGD